MSVPTTRRRPARSTETGTAVPSLAAGAVLAGITLAAAAAVASPGGPTGATASYTSTTPLTIGGPRATGSPSTLEVVGAGTRVTDVDVALAGFSHTRPRDVDLVLVGPDGQRATVLSDGVTPVPSHDTSLTVFEGTNPNGTWRLHVVDGAGDGAGDGRGRLQGWSLRLTTHTPGDTLRPRIASTYPADGATAVDPGVDVRATLSESVRPTTVTGSTVQLVEAGTDAPVDADVTWRGDTRSLRLDPVADLAPRTTYRVVVTDGVRDHGGNALDQDPATAGAQLASWTFTTR
jgi:subtilisin-like proprotein convertase family protein